MISVLEFFALLCVAGLSGIVALAITRSRAGCLAAIGLGFIGALIGTFCARILGLPEFLMIRVGDQPFPLIWSVIGAVLFVLLVHWFQRRRTEAR